MALLFFASKEYSRGRRTARIEDALPAALLQVSSLGPRASAGQVLSAIASSGFGPLSDEFAQAKRQYDAGMPLPNALNELASRNNSLLLSRVCRLLSSAYSSGVDLSHACRALAEDSQSALAIHRERQASLALQKYTAIAASLLLPVILGVLVKTTASLAGGSELSPQRSEDLADAIRLSGLGYSAVLAAVASAYAALLDGNLAKAAFYGAVLVPLAVAAFLVASGGV